PPSSYSGLAGGPSGPLPAASNPPTAQPLAAPGSPGKSSFLDEWLSKHKTTSSAPMSALPPVNTLNPGLSPLPPRPLNVAATPSPILTTQPVPTAEPPVKINPPTEITSP